MLSEFIDLNIRRILSTIIIFSATLIAQDAVAEDVSVVGAIQSQKRCVADFCFPVKASIKEEDIPLRSIAKKRYLIFDLYMAAFYLQPEVKDIDGVLSESKKKLVFRYLRDFNGSDVIEAADKILQSNPELDLSTLKSRLDEINLAYGPGIKEGDIFELEYEPSRGTILRKNGAELKIIAGADFCKAYFGIWLSRFPLDEKFRDALISSPAKSPGV